MTPSLIAFIAGNEMKTLIEQRIISLLTNDEIEESVLLHLYRGKFGSMGGYPLHYTCKQLVRDGRIRLKIIGGEPARPGPNFDLIDPILAYSLKEPIQ